MTDYCLYVFCGVYFGMISAMLSSLFVVESGISQVTTNSAAKLNLILVPICTESGQDMTVSELPAAVTTASAGTLPLPALSLWRCWLLHWCPGRPLRASRSGCSFHSASLCTQLWPTGRFLGTSVEEWMPLEGGSERVRERARESRPRRSAPTLH